MPRPPTHSDDELLDLVAAGVTRSGAGWTLDSASRDAGVHAATLIKRFGSRHGLLVALARRWVAAIPARPTRVDPEAELEEWISGASTAGATGEEVLHALDMLCEDLTDPELRSLLHEGWSRQATYLSCLLTAAGHARGGSSDELAGLLLDLSHGRFLRSAASPDPPALDPSEAVRSLLRVLG